MKTRITSAVLITLALFFPCLGNVQAVNPPPDGGYPGGNTAEGQKALLSLTTGGFNTAVGYLSLRSNTTGSFNTAIGAGTLLANGGDGNTATGAGALLSNTAGGFSNTADGAFVLFSNTDGDGNTASGYQALFANQSGSNNAAFGYTALYHNTESFNTAFGSQTLVNNTEGHSNTAVGYQALVFNTLGYGNTAIGAYALYSNTTGYSNIALGESAGVDLATGHANIYIGNAGVAAESGTIRIGDLLSQTATYIVGIFGTTIPGGAPVYIAADGQLGTNSSSACFKQNIQDMGGLSDALLALRPVTFQYKKELDPKGIPQFGLVAEEVEKVNPDLVVRDKEGKSYSVRYDQVNAMLLNEFLKEHRKVEEQQVAITELKSLVAQQQKEFRAVIAEQKEMEARLREQDSKIHRVSSRIQSNKTAPELAAK
jgi:hypothetical protein